ncbi:hypothetical protein [Bacteroides thetaiotaomicron]|uniref:hypothetical protein n=1 Tax=Bacteroides thetaiotaomicron TaxID=818 RepID=UPI00077768AF|nr:hypothetical protein [Bacteroides thetaiotaomicron]KXT44675.1 hypothetical protein HMPREF2534_00420 [Bacteroides thetaiotaomicron]
MKEEQLLKMAEQVKKTCEENGITVLMLIGKTEEDRVNSTNLLMGKVNTLATMIVGLMNESTEFSKLIQNASEYYSVQQRESKQESLAKQIEEFFKELYNHRNSNWVSRG